MLCKEHARRLLDSAERGDWDTVEEVLKSRPEFINYQPEKGERDSAGEKRRTYCVLHWAAEASKPDLMSRLLLVQGVDPMLPTAAAMGECISIKCPL